MAKGTGFLKENRVQRTAPNSIRTPDGLVMGLNLTNGREYSHDPREIFNHNMSMGVPRSLGNLGTPKSYIPLKFILSASDGSPGCLAINPIATPSTTNCNNGIDSTNILYTYYNTYSREDLKGYAQIRSESGRIIFNKNNAEVGSLKFEYTTTPAVFALWKFEYVGTVDALRTAWRIRSAASEKAPKNADHIYLKLKGDDGKYAGVLMGNRSDPGCIIHLKDLAPVQ